MPRRRVSPAALVFALLVLATVAAFAWSQQVKRNPLILDKVEFGIKKSPAFTPNFDCRFDKTRIRFRVTRSDLATVQVIDLEGRLVQTLASEVFLRRYTIPVFYWDGRQLDGTIAARGRYKLRVHLIGQDRVLVTPGSIKLHEAPRNPTPDCRWESGEGRDRGAVLEPPA